MKHNQRTEHQADQSHPPQRQSRGRRPAKAIVIGAGIGGLTAAIALRRVGVEVEVYERASQLAAKGSALSVMSNAISALDSLGIDLALERRGQVANTFTIMDSRGRHIRELPMREVSDALGVPNVCISRADLQQALLEAADDCSITLGAAATGYTSDVDGVEVEFADGRQARGDLLIGADGINSVVRHQLVGPEEAKDSGYICWLALTSFSHPRLRPGYVGHYWGNGQRFGLIDIGHGRYYWWGTKNMPAARSHSWQGGKDEVVSAYSGWAEEVREVIRVTPQDAILGVPSRDRRFLERWGDGPVTLLGDAAHPMLTTLGQGAAMAIEDAVVLARTLAEGDDSLPLLLRRYEGRRRERARTMVVASRSMSDLQQMEGPKRLLARDAYFRLVPRRVLLRQQKAALTFPGIPA
ncbi:FAD-dependent monooxygenase [Streptomyces sp. NPDC090442]|uniref:FAD-dependent monooxygenase n=1 Tax=Streptomyces sp. NPDC090442 TaxID=3365962 RepID=UPI0038025138